MSIKEIKFLNAVTVALKSAVAEDSDLSGFKINNTKGTYGKGRTFTCTDSTDGGEFEIIIDIDKLAR